MTFRTVIPKKELLSKMKFRFSHDWLFSYFPYMEICFLCDHVQFAIYKNIFLIFDDHLHCISMYIPFCCLLRIAVLS